MYIYSECIHRVGRKISLVVCIVVGFGGNTQKYTRSIYIYVHSASKSGNGDQAIDTMIVFFILFSSISTHVE